jgi:hypothetical protein
MKKAFPFAALLLAAAGSWAFYPKAPAEPTGYMMVVSHFSGNAFSAKGTISTISPDGEVQNNFDAKNGSGKQIIASYDQLHLVETQKLNELRQAGWRLVATHQSASVSLETTFILEKQ